MRELTIGALSLPPVFAAVLMILAGTPRFVERQPRPTERPPTGPTPDRSDARLERAL
jgi:hypothetical protein